MGVATRPWWMTEEPSVIHPGGKQGGGLQGLGSRAGATAKVHGVVFRVTKCPHGGREAAPVTPESHQATRLRWVERVAREPPSVKAFKEQEETLHSRCVLPQVKSGRGQCVTRCQEAEASCAGGNRGAGDAHGAWATPHAQTPVAWL